jgi:serine/threonine protein kinase
MSGYSESTAATIIYQLISALGYLHKKGIIHRNIRAGNILLNEKGKLDIKVIDFDVAGTKTIEAVTN